MTEGFERIPDRTRDECGDAGPKARAAPMDLPEWRVLTCLVDGYDELYYGFDYIASDTGLTRIEVRDRCRSLAVRGFARFMRGLMTEEGAVAGSGYGCTRAGADVYWNATKPAVAPVEASPRQSVQPIRDDSK